VEEHRRPKAAADEAQPHEDRGPSGPLPSHPIPPGAPPPSFQYTASTDFQAVATVLKTEASPSAPLDDHLAPVRVPAAHSVPEVPVLDTFKRKWYQNWFGDRSFEKTDPYGFSSAATSKAASRSISRTTSPVPIATATDVVSTGNSAAARRASLGLVQNATTPR
jgi:hypothetical protein